MNDVSIVGAGMTDFGELWEDSYRELAVRAGLKAVDDSDVKLDDIDSLYVGTMSPGQWIDQEHVGPLIADYLGLKGVKTVRTESACASSSIAFHQAVKEIQSGTIDTALVLGVEKMTDVSNSESITILSSGSDAEEETYHGITFPGLFALIARKHMKKYGTTREQLAKVAVKNHRNGANNPHAHYQRKIKVEDVLESQLIADPLRLYDCSPVSDGASAVIVTNNEKAEKFTDLPIEVTGMGSSTDTMALHDRKDITKTQVTIDSSKQAYKMSGLKPEDIDVAELHDCFTINEIIAYEDLGFTEKGKGGKLIEEGQTEIGGKIPVNTSGGLKAKGHPVGATGVSQLIELFRQLREERDKRQVGGAEVGLAHNVGGSASSGTITILKRSDSSKGR